jgi:hypothetical protein
VDTVDTFMEEIRRLEAMSPTRRENVLDLAREECICGECPSHTDCMKEKGELLYCLAQKSACTVVRRVCLCPTCQLTPRLGLAHGYYCARGSEKEIRKIA